MATLGTFGAIFLLCLLLRIQDGNAKKIVAVLKTDGDSVVDELLCDYEIGESHELFIKPDCLDKQIRKKKEELFVDYFTTVTTETSVFIAGEICNASVLHPDLYRCSSNVEGLVMTKTNLSVSANREWFDLTFECAQFCNPSQFEQQIHRIKRSNGSRAYGQEIFTSYVKDLSEKLSQSIYQTDGKEDFNIEYDDVDDINFVQNFSNKCIKYVQRHGWLRLPTDPPKSADAKQGKPGDPKPGDPKPGDPKPGDPKPGEAKPGGAKPGEAKPGDPKPGEAKPGDPKPGDAKPGGAKPGEAKPGEGKPGEAKPGDGKPGEAKPGDAATQPKPDEKPGGKPAGPAAPSKPGGEPESGKPAKRSVYSSALYIDLKNAGGCHPALDIYRDYIYGNL